MSTYTAFRCPNDLLRKAKRIADSERRSLSNYIVRLLEEDAARRAVREMRLNEEEKGQHLHRVSYAS